MQGAKTDRVTVLPEVRRGGVGALRHIPPSHLSDVELVALIAGDDRSPVEATLERVQGISGLIGLSSSELRACGFSRSGASAISAALELSVRLAKCEIGVGELLNDPDAVARYLFLKYRRPIQEVMGAIYLNQRNRAIEDREFFCGTLTRAAVEPRPILRTALELGAAGVVLFHTHPSGDPEPSAEDLAFTRRLDEAGDVVGVQLVDHLILGSPSRWVSIRKRGW